MMREMQVTKEYIFFGLWAWITVFIVLALGSWNPGGLLYVVGAPLLFFLPGALTLLFFDVKGVSLWGRVVLALMVSILEVLLFATFGNGVLPWVGIDRPLDTLPLTTLFMGAIVLLIIATRRRICDVMIQVPTFVVGSTVREVVHVLFASTLVALSVWGAFSLNVGGGNAFTMVLIASVGIFTLYLFSYMRRLPQLASLPIILYSIALALLLMTSLRGSFVSGHDTQREFFVFQLALDAGLWSPSTYIDAYNACLSITVLPTVIANVLHMPDVLVFKVFFQALFAFSAILIFLIVRRWFDQRLAFLATFLFMAFPTFFQDMPFLLRQEVAFLFFGAMLYVLFEDALSIVSRRALFLLFGVGVILSHYATTYIILFVFTFAYLLLVVVRAVLKRYGSEYGLRSMLEVRIPGLEYREIKVTWVMILALVVSSLVWTHGVTRTGGHVGNVVGETVSSIQAGFAGYVRSPDISALLMVRGTENPTLREYADTRVEDLRAQNPELYYASSTYATFAMREIEQSVRDITRLGEVRIFGISLQEMTRFIGSILAKCMQVAIPIGITVVLFSLISARRIDVEYYAYAVASTVFIVLCMVIPVLSREYGIFRALQQSMFVLTPFMSIGLLSLSQGVSYVLSKSNHVTEGNSVHEFSYRMSGVLIVLFFLFSTGFVGQAMGKNIPAVHLNNTGDDFNHYIITEDEARAMEWLKKRVEQDVAQGAVPVVQADRFGQKKLQSVLHTPVYGDIYPGLIQKGAYVFIGPSTFDDGVAVVSFEGTLIKYTYPLVFLETQKSLLYSNKRVRIYK